MAQIKKTNWTQLNQKPLTYLQDHKIKEKQLQQILEIASHSYYESNIELLSDKSFDILKDYLEENYPANKFLQQIGSQVKGPNKVKLPIHMGSMDKKKKEKDIVNWIKKYPHDVIISDKLDGISFLLVIRNGKQQLLTRGNGTEGKDISQIIPYLKLPKLDKSTDIIIRGEMLVSQKNFELVQEKFSNGRSFISGLSNFKELTPERKKYLKLVDLVCYELVKPNLKTETQLLSLKKMGYSVVPHRKENKIDFALLQKILLDRKQKSNYDIDGIIITSNQINERIKSGNPKYSFAFKMDLEFAITTVKSVEWNASKHGKLKPIVNLEPVMLCGTKNSKATGNNADFIEKNKIGPGAKVRIIKGGEIIPKIEEVLQGTKPQFPNIKYVWNETHKEIMLLDMDNEAMKIKKLVNFFKTIEVDNLGPGLITKLYQNGFNTITKICLIQVEDLLTLEGIKEKMALKLTSNIKKVLDSKIPLEKIISGSCLLGDGLGEKILVKVLTHFKIKEIIDLDKINLPGLVSIDGIEEKTAKKLLVGIPKIKKFLLENPFLKFKVMSDIKSGIFENQGVVLSGKRDTKIKEFLEKEGAEVKTIVNSKTAFIIVDSIDLTTSKIQKAKDLKIQIYTSMDFKEKYNL